MMRCAVIISAYNNFATLRKTLWGFEAQTVPDFDILIADDGSSTAFSDQLSDFIAHSSMCIKHIWHPDDGFRKCTILNKAICAADSEYLIFADADIVPRNDFVANHLRLSRPKRFISGGSHVNIPAEIHSQLTEDDIKRQSLFNMDWLREQDIASSKHFWRLSFHGAAAQLLDFLTPRWNAFVGCNASAYREDALAINGFDETFVYGGLDRDFGVRLANYGVMGVRHRYSLCCVHLDHPRPYVDPATVRMQKKRFADRYRAGVTQAEVGIREQDC